MEVRLTKGSLASGPEGTLTHLSESFLAGDSKMVLYLQAQQTSDLVA